MYLVAPATPLYCANRHGAPQRFQRSAVGFNPDTLRVVCFCQTQLGLVISQIDSRSLDVQYATRGD